MILFFSVEIKANRKGKKSWLNKIKYFSIEYKREDPPDSEKWSKGDLAFRLWPISKEENDAHYCPDTVSKEEGTESMYCSESETDKNRYS